MLIAVFSFAMSGFFAKLSLSVAAVSSTVFIRFFIPILILLCAAKIFKKKIAFQREKFWLQLLRAAALTSSQLCFFYSIKGLPLAEATALYNTGPIFIAIFSCFFGSRLSFQKSIALFSGAIGVCLICHIEAGVFNGFIFVGILSGISFSISQMAFHKISKSGDNLSNMFSLYVLAAIFSFIIKLLFGSSFESLAISSYQNIALHELIILMMVGVCSLGNQYFRGKAYSLAKSSSDLAPLIYLSVFISTMFDAVFFNVIPDMQASIGAVLIVVAAYFTSMKKQLFVRHWPFVTIK